MEIIEESTDVRDVEPFRVRYQEQARKGPVDEDVTFAYAYAMIRTTDYVKLKYAVSLLSEILHKTDNDIAKRDYLFYMAIAHLKRSEYDEAVKYANAVLSIQPNNNQALELLSVIKRKRNKDGAIGLAVLGGGAALAVGAIVGLGVALTRKK